MTRLIQVVWGAGLVAAYVAALAVVKEVMLVVKSLQDIHRLAEITGEAARGIRQNVASIESLAGAEVPAGTLVEASNSVAAATRLLEQKVARLGPGTAERGR
jgi:hypothetical protein